MYRRIVTAIAVLLLLLPIACSDDSTSPPVTNAARSNQMAMLQSLAQEQPGHKGRTSQPEQSHG